MFGSQKSGEGVAVEVLWICLTFVLLLAKGSGSSSASNPGLKIRVSRAGLEYAANVAVDDLSERVKRVAIRDQKSSADVSIGRVEYEITNIKVRLHSRWCLSMWVSLSLSLYPSLSVSLSGFRSLFLFVFVSAFVPQCSACVSFAVSVFLNSPSYLLAYLPATLLFSVPLSLSR